MFCQLSSDDILVIFQFSHIRKNISINDLRMFTFKKHRKGYICLLKYYYNFKRGLTIEIFTIC